MSRARQSTCVALQGRGLLIEGPPGAGKSSLALALLDRGAVLVGDDSVLLQADAGMLTARPHPETRGLLEVRNLGLVPMPVCDCVRVCLVILLDDTAPRYIEAPESTAIEGLALPLVRLWSDGTVALKAELALERFGLPA